MNNSIVFTLKSRPLPFGKFMVISFRKSENSKSIFFLAGVWGIIVKNRQDSGWEDILELAIRYAGMTVNLEVEEEIC